LHLGSKSLNPVPIEDQRTLPYVDTSGSGKSRTSGQQVELIEDRTEHQESTRLNLYQKRIRQIAYLLLVVYILFTLRDLASLNGHWQDLQFRVLLSACVLQSLLVLLTRSRLPKFRTGRFALELVLLLLCGFVIDTLHYLHFTAWSTYAEYFASHPRDAQIQMANIWALNWLALIVGYSVAVPRAWRQTVLVAFLLSFNPVVVTILTIHEIPGLQQFDTRFFFIQYAIWGFVTIMISAFAAAQNNQLRDEVQQARRFGQYILKRKIGEGGMGEVFLAEHRLLKRPCVIKQIRQDRAHDPKIIARFEREVKLLATLTNWHTVEVFDYGRTTDGHFYFVMEYLPGSNLEDLVQKSGPLQPERAAFVLAQVCLGLHEAHSVNLIHRDVKPSNIIIGPRGGLHDVAKLLDFGLVQGPLDHDDQDQGKITREGMVLGSVSYMSPEQARGDSLDGRSDIYAIGITLFYLLEGRPPFQKRSLLETLAAHLHEPLPELKNPISPKIWDILQRCTAKRAEDRFQDVLQLREALLECAQEWNQSRAAECWNKREL
jgi:eukaryotic-like serine/threonine-protein kinase